LTQDNTKFSKKTLRYQQKRLALEAQERESAKRDLERAQELKRTRAQKLGAAWMHLAETDRRYSDLLRIAVEQLKRERGGKAFEGWAVPGVHDAGDAESHVNDVIATIEAEAASDGSVPPEEDQPQTASADIQNARAEISWEISFPRMPSDDVRARLKQIGEFNKVAKVWKCRSDHRTTEEIRPIIEQAGGVLVVTSISGEPKT